MRVLNVGGGVGRALPSIYDGYDQVLLDIDPLVEPDVVCDARKIRGLRANQYDAIHCSHTLEHFYDHEVPGVLGGFRHVLKPKGFAYVAVPNLTALFRDVVVGCHDIHDTWYKAGPHSFSFHDVLYGWGKQVASGNEHYCHRTGFTEKSLGRALRAAGFVGVNTAPDRIGNLFAFAFKTKPAKGQLRRLGL